MVESEDVFFFVVHHAIDVANQIGAFLAHHLQHVVRDDAFEDHVALVMVLSELVRRDQVGVDVDVCGDVGVGGGGHDGTFQRLDFEIVVGKKTALRVFLRLRLKLISLHY